MDEPRVTKGEFAPKIELEGGLEGPLAGYGALAGRLTGRAIQPRFARLTNRIAGSLLVTAGVGMATLRRS